MLPIPPPELLEKYSRPGPRYTSYPPATEFKPEFGVPQTVERLEAADAVDAPLSIYVHLPFCAEMCRFCGCNAIATRDRTRADAYLDVLAREIDLWTAHLPHRRRVNQLHLGGGTPTFLTVEQLRRLHALITRSFRIEPGAELALEVDPVVTTAEQLEVLGGLGFNRLSAGVQDLDPQVQQATNRIQSAEQTEAVLKAARASGFESVNVDLMYGLPYQKVAVFTDTVRRVLDMGPDRFALFGFAYVPWMKPHQRLLPQSHLPDTAARVELFVSAARVLEERGFRQIGLDHFARADDPLSRAQADGTLYRNFQGYTTRAAPDTLALGVTSISDLAGGFLQSFHKLSEWEAAVGEGRLPVERGLLRTRDDELRGAAIRNLMCLLRFDVAPLRREFGADADALWESVRPAMEPLAADGLLVAREGGFDVTPLGRLFLRNLAMPFDAYLSRHAEKPAFSKTV